MKSILLATALALTTTASFAADTIWHVKAIHPEGRLIDIKAVGKDGTLYPVKAVQSGDNMHLLDIKALVGNAKLPVKILPGSSSGLQPVKAIGTDGAIYDIKAIMPDGQKLGVKGVATSGNITHIKAIGSGGAKYGVKALSREGRLYDIKGIRLTGQKIEGTVNGVEFAAHIKALPQAAAGK